MNVHGAPDRIYLVYGDVPEDTRHADCAEVTWCEDRVGESDVQYIRADLLVKMEADVQRLERSRVTLADGLEQEEAENQALHEKVAASEAQVERLTTLLRDDVPAILRWLPSPAQMGDKDAAAEKRLRAALVAGEVKP